MIQKGFTKGRETQIVCISAQPKCSIPKSNKTNPLWDTIVCPLLCPLVTGRNNIKIKYIQTPAVSLISREGRHGLRQTSALLFLGERWVKTAPQKTRISSL